MEMPERINPGPFAARVTFFAPVSLLFFLTVTVIAGATSGPALHPMHYWFISAAFFAFHLLLAYLVDHVNLHLAFAVAALTSVTLVVTYVRSIAGTTRLVLTIGAAQFVFLVLFSYAFFLEGFTGLTITIGSIVTLFVLMQVTARVAWDEVFQSGAQVPGAEVGHAARR
jgi:inner membrane protein involved in colicin E2 resistance